MKGDKVGEGGGEGQPGNRVGRGWTREVVLRRRSVLDASQTFVCGRAAGKGTETIGLQFVGDCPARRTGPHEEGITSTGPSGSCLRGTPATPLRLPYH